MRKAQKMIWMMALGTCLLSVPLTAEEPRTAARLNVAATRLDWQPAADYESLALTVTGPQDLFIQREFKAGQVPFLGLFDSSGNPLPDGNYVYELRGARSGEREVVVESGYFSVQQGSFATAADPQPVSAQRGKPRVVTAMDNVINDDLIVTGNACVGTGCVDGESFATPVEIKTSAPGIRLEDTSACCTADADWEINANSGADNLIIRDRDASTTPFTITGAAPTNSLFIASSGSVGIGTSTPSSKFHVSGGDIRVSSGSFIDDGTTLNVPDYVFEPHYELMPLDELRSFISREKHLPNVPSRDDVKKDGLNLSQVQMRLLEKLEELTLYTLKQDEQVKALQGENARLNARLQALEQAAASEQQ